jgi:hypothetical protein
MESIIVFPDTHSAIKAERCLLDAKVSVSVMPLPESIGSGCGIALRLDSESLRLAADILRECSVSISAIYSREKTQTGYEYVKGEG